jgi:hypothetical protein
MMPAMRAIEGLFLTAFPAGATAPCKEQPERNDEIRHRQSLGGKSRCAEGLPRYLVALVARGGVGAGAAAAPDGAEAAALSGGNLPPGSPK